MNTYNGKPIEVFISNDPKLLNSKLKEFMSRIGKYDSVTCNGNRIVAYPAP